MQTPIDDKTWRDVNHLSMAQGIIRQLRLELIRGEPGFRTMLEIDDAIRVGTVLELLGYDVHSRRKDLKSYDFEMFVQPKPVGYMGGGRG